MKGIFKKLGSVVLYFLVIYGGLNAINTALLPSEYKKLVALGFKKIKTFHQRHDEKEVTEEEKEFATKALREKLRNDRARAEQIQKNIEAFEKKNNSSIQKKVAKHKGLQELNETNANPLNDNPNSNSSTETKSNKDDNFDEMINKVNEAFVKPAAPLVPNEWRTPEIEIIINECIISSNDYDGLRKCLIKDIKDQKILAPLLEKIQEIETENNKFSRQHLSDLKLALNNSRNDNKNRMEAKAQANSQKDKIFALINKEASKEARAAAFDPNLKGIRSELSDKLENINKNLKDFGKSFDDFKNGKNNDFSKAEETLKALKDSVKDLGINPEWISKIENLNAALNDFKNGKNKDFSKVTQAKSDLENSIKDVIINQKITDKVDNLNQAVSEAKLAGDFSKVEQALAELKNLSLDLGKNSDLQKSVKNGVNGTLVGNGLSKTEATTLTKNFSDIRKELNEKLFGNSNNNNNGLKNNNEPIYAQVNKKKTGQAASPEEPIYAQVAKKVSAKIDQLNEATSAINRKIDRINKIASAGKGVGGFSGAGRSASPEPIYATIDFDEANQAGFPLRRSAAVNDLSKVGLSREQELTHRIGDLNQAVSEAKTGHFDNLEQKIDELKDSTKKNALKLWVESAKQVPTSLQAKLDNYATNSHTRINSNVQSGTINEKATGMLTQKNPEWLKLVNDKIVAHNVGSAHLSEYDKIGFNQKNMKDYSDSFKFSTKLNNAVKDIKSSFVQFLTNTFSTGSYSLMKANVEHGVKNTTKSGFQKS